MKKLVIAIDEEKEVSEDIKTKIAYITQELNGKISGVIRYPEMITLTDEDMLFNTIKMAKPDYVLFTDIDCMLSEIINDCSLTKKMDKINVKMIDVTMAAEISQIIDGLPKEMISSLKQEFHNMNADKEKVLILCSQNISEDELKMFVENIDESKGVIMELELNSYQKGMNDRLMEFIKDNSIDKVIVFNEPSSQDFKEFLTYLTEKGIPVDTRTYDMSNMMKFDMSLN